MGLDDLLRPAGHGPAAAREGTGHRPDRAPGIPLDPLHDRGVGPRELLDAALEHGRGVLEGCRGGTGNPADVTLDALHDGGMSPDDGICGSLGGLDPAGDGPSGFPDDGGRGDGAGGVRVRGGRPLLGLLRLERLRHHSLGGVECSHGLSLERGPEVLSGPDARRNG